MFLEDSNYLANGILLIYVQLYASSTKSSMNYIILVLDKIKHYYNITNTRRNVNAMVDLRSYEAGQDNK